MTKPHKVQTDLDNDAQNDVNKEVNELKHIVANLQQKISDVYMEEIDNLIKDHPDLRDSKDDIIKRLNKKIMIDEIDDKDIKTGNDIVLEMIEIEKGVTGWLGTDNYLYDNTGKRIGVKMENEYLSYNSLHNEQEKQIKEQIVKLVGNKKKADKIMKGYTKIPVSILLS